MSDRSGRKGTVKKKPVENSHFRRAAEPLVAPMPLSSPGLGEKLHDVLSAMVKRDPSLEIKTLSAAVYYRFDQKPLWRIEIQELGMLEGQQDLNTGWENSLTEAFEALWRDFEVWKS